MLRPETHYVCALDSFHGFPVTLGLRHDLALPTGRQTAGFAQLAISKRTTTVRARDSLAGPAMARVSVYEEHAIPQALKADTAI